MLVCDVADIFLELAKLFHYSKKEMPATIAFLAFAVIWITTRLGVYPGWIMRSYIVDAPKLANELPGYEAFISLLVALMILNLIWTYSILKVLCDVITDNPTKDVRSESSEELTDEAVSESTQQAKKME